MRTALLVEGDMPSVMRIDGARVTIFPNDHRPAHVHVVSGRGEAVFNLNCPDGPARIRESYGFSRAELTRLQATLSDAVVGLCDEWSRIHGD